MLCRSLLIFYSEKRVRIERPKGQVALPSVAVDRWQRNTTLVRSTREESHERSYWLWPFLRSDSTIMGSFNQPCMGCEFPMSCDLVVAGYHVKESRLAAGLCKQSHQEIQPQNPVARTRKSYPAILGKVKRGRRTSMPRSIGAAYRYPN